MKPVTIYTTPSCPFCLRAKRLLSTKGVQYVEIDVAGGGDAREKLTERNGQTTCLL